MSAAETKPLEMNSVAVILRASDERLFDSFI
jgi:hypothetical protein